MSCRIELTVLSGVSAGDVFRYTVEPGKAIQIGRNAECDLVLQDSSVSRMHAQILFRGDAFMLSDLGSSYGTVHMGFHLKKGDDGARELHDNDEFKIGQQIFRINFPEDSLRSSPAPEKDASSKNTVNQGGFGSRGQFGKKKISNLMIALIAAVALALGALFLLTPGEPPRAASQNNQPLIPPVEGAIGYWSGRKDQGGSDDTHVGKAFYKLPSSNLVIDFDFVGEGSVKVSLDEKQIGEIPKADVWGHKQIILRDLRLGRERNLIFENPSYFKPGDKTIQHWAVRNLRVRPLKDIGTGDLNDQLGAAATSAESLQSGSTNLQSAIKAFQIAILGELIELYDDAVICDIPAESNLPDPTELKQHMSQLISERNRELSNEVSRRHLGFLAETTGRLEAELWRRVNSRISSARLAAGAKNYIEAYDSLRAAIAMFPNDDPDYRLHLSQSVFNDTSVIPKYIKKSPDKYRKRRID